MSWWQITGYSINIFCGLTAAFFIYFFVDHYLKTNDKVIINSFRHIEKVISEDVIAVVMLAMIFADMIMFVVMAVVTLSDHTFFAVYFMTTVFFSVLFLPRLLLISLSRNLFPARARRDDVRD